MTVPAPAMPVCRTLAEYVAALVAELGRADPAALERMQRVVGSAHARIGLDDEAVDVWFSNGGELALADAGADQAVDGEGYTDRATVLDLLDGYLEVTEALSSGRLQVRGGAGEVIRIFQAIEILLDSSPRVPPLQRLAADFRLDPCREGRFRVRPAPAEVPELALLDRLGLLNSLDAHGPR